MVQPACKYCGKVLAAYADAQQKVMQVQALMGDANGNGIPDALEGMVGPYAGMMRPMPPAYGMPPAPYGVPPSPYGIQGAPYGVPPAIGMPMASPPMMGAPVVNANMYAAAGQMQRRFTMWIVLSVAVPTVLGIVVAIVSMIAAFAGH